MEKSGGTDDRHVHSQYLAHFFHHTAIEVKTYMRHFKQLEKDLKQGYEERFPQILLLTGARGSGRKKFLTRLARKTCTDCINIIDCGLFSTENRLWERIYKAFVDVDVNDAKREESGEDAKREKPDDDAKRDELGDDEKMRELFAQHLQETKTILYLDNIELFCEKRQSFLYSFLDNLSLMGSAVCLAFGTTDVFFHEKLEKRVKSRFSFVSYVFDFKQTCPHNFLLEFAAKGTRLPHISVFKGWLAASSCEESVKRLGEFCFDLGAFLRLINCALCHFPAHLFEPALRAPQQRISARIAGREEEFACAQKLFERCLEKAQESLFGFSRVRIIQRLPRLQQLILKMLARECAPGEGCAGMNAKALVAKMLPTQPGHRFSSEAVFFGMEDLIAHDMLGVAEGALTSSSQVFLKCDSEESCFIRDSL